MKTLCVSLLLLGLPALADNDEPNSFLMLGFDLTGKKLYLKEELGRNGPFDLWTIDFAKPAEPTIKISPLDAKDKGPQGLTVVKSVVLEEVEFNGLIRKESLERHGNSLMERYDLRATVEWKGARTTSDLIAYRSPELQLVEVFKLPEGESPCALAVVGFTSNLAGVLKQRPLVMCPPSNAPSPKPPGKSEGATKR